MRPPLEFILPPEIGTEILYSFVIILISLFIYYSTKEMYELSFHKGIKYFRKSFLFFAIAYFFRYFLIFFLLLFDLGRDFSWNRIIFKVSLFLFIYYSSMAVFYLLHSVMWKKWDSRKRKYLWNILAIVIALIGTIFDGMLISLLINLILLIFVSIILYIAYRDSGNRKKNNWLLGIYFLLFIFWTLNMINILVPKFLQIYQLIIYLASIGLFMAILYRVLKKVGN